MRHHVVEVAEIVLASCSILYHNNNEGRFFPSSFFFGKFFSRPLPERLLFTVLYWDDNNRERASPWRSLGLYCCRLSTERWKAASPAVASKRSTVVGRLTFAPLFCLYHTASITRGCVKRNNIDIYVNDYDHYAFISLQK